MDDFSTPNSSNYFGLQASNLNYIQSGKRSMSMISPSIILGENGNVRLTISAACGSHIITSCKGLCSKQIHFVRN
jgi:gamma-glutamyltranspeptidase/glutathione hydrolase/leukotriene-C4 hydrolase